MPTRIVRAKAIICADVLGVVICDVDIEKVSDLAFIDNFDFSRKLRDNRIARGVGDTADEDIVNIDTHDDVSIDVYARVCFESLKPYTYNNLR